MGTMPRRCFYTNESFGQHSSSGFYFELAEVRENTAGYSVAGTFRTVEKALETMRIRNDALGVSEKDVMEIVASSMRAGKVR